MMFDNRSPKALIMAMSGGVDSSVAAHILLEKGIEVTGMTMRLFRDNTGIESKKCGSEADINDARKVAEKLGIPFSVLDYYEEFKSCVVKKFIDEYEAGRTPNPCVDCNRDMKFGKIIKTADEQGFDGIATGHYARVDYDENTGRYLLKKAADLSKDQSYVLYVLTQEQLSKVYFPLGELSKDETRKIAESLGFENASKPDSQDICFVPDGDYRGFIERYKGIQYKSGDIIDTDGNVLGSHSGAIGYTLGQRKGLGLAMGEPVYVCSKDMKNNTVTVGKEENLFYDTVFVSDMNWISIESLKAPMRICAKLRYRQKESPAWMYPEENGNIKLVFDEAQRAPAAGQAAVIYDGDVVVGGGTILD